MRKLTLSERTVQTPMRCYGILNEHLDHRGHLAWTWAQSQGLPTEAHLIVADIGCPLILH